MYLFKEVKKISEKLKILAACLVLMSCNGSDVGDSKEYDDDIALGYNQKKLSRDVQAGSHYLHEISDADIENYFKDADLSTIKIVEGPDWLNYNYDRRDNPRGNRAFFSGVVPESTSEELQAVPVKGQISSLDGTVRDWEFTLGLKENTAPEVYVKDRLLTLGSDWEFEITEDMISDLTDAELNEGSYSIAVNEKPDWLEVDEAMGLRGVVPVNGFGGSAIVSGSIEDSSGNVSNWSFNLVAKGSDLDLVSQTVEAASEFKYQITDVPDIQQLDVNNFPCWLTYSYDSDSNVLTFAGIPSDEDVGHDIVAGTVVNNYNISTGWSFDIHVTEDVAPVIKSVVLDDDVPDMDSTDNKLVLQVDLDGATPDTVIKAYADSQCNEGELASVTLDDYVSAASVQLDTELGEGMHTFYVSATEASGNVSSCVGLATPHVVDTTAPVLSGVVVKERDKKNNNKNPLLSVYFKGADSGSVVTAYSDPTCEAPIDSKTLDSSVDSVDVPLKDISPDGGYIFYASVTDASGNKSECTGTDASLPYVLDTVTPAVLKIELIAPANSISSNNKPILRVVVSDPTGSTVKIYSDNTCSKEIGSADINGRFMSSAIVVDDGLADGQYLFHAMTYDDVGNKSECTPGPGKGASYTVDTYEESCVVNGLVDSTFPANSKTLNWSGCDEYQHIVTDSREPNEEFVWSDWGTVSEKTLDSSTLIDKEGMFYLHVRGRNRDNVSNVSEVSPISTAQVFIDTKKPTITGIEQDDSEVAVSSKTWKLGCDDERGCFYRYGILEQELNATDTAFIESFLSGRKYSDINSISQNCGSGLNYLFVQARDSAGNESDIFRSVVKLDPSGDNSGC